MEYKFKPNEIDWNLTNTEVALENGLIQARIENIKLRIELYQLQFQFRKTKREMERMWRDEKKNTP